MRSSIKSFMLPAVIVVVGLVVVGYLSDLVEENRVTMPPAYADSDLAFQGKYLRGYALGTEGMIADWYWINSLQYIGGKFVNSTADYIDINDLSSFNPRLLYPYLDNATELDPKMVAAYTYGATMLPAIDRSQAIALTEKGIRNNPDNWRLYHLLGYIYWKSNDFEKAAQAYDRGLQTTDPPQFMKMMAALMRTQGGSRGTARAMYQQMLEGTPDEQTRSNAEFRLSELDSLDERDAIRQAIKQFREKNGSCPQSIRQLLPLLQTVELPSGKDFRIDKDRNIVDPSDAPYLLDQQTCDVKLDPARTKMPLS